MNLFLFTDVFILAQTKLAFYTATTSAMKLCTASTPLSVTCPSHYKCRDGNCAKRTTVCDGNACDGCAEDDEWKAGNGFKCIRDGSTCRLPQQLLWDNVQDCDDGSDLCYNVNLTYSDGRSVPLRV